ncbi:unnamed protein product [Cercopithifilaria johnstoni]|uniref:Uncharacterized protein n=1 Tax=Cercopithifilaria johnstoni TaxID=2874296 RepID=A0A8J2PZP1_9BILA|nr:unnamed protein product [Cercopithifilaria johnstoni]
MAADNPNTIAAALDLRRWTTTLSGASLPKISIKNMLKNREIGRRGRPASHRLLSSMPNTSSASECPISYHASSMPNTSAAFTLSEKANLVNRSVVHLKFNIDRLNSGLFRCIHLPDEKLIGIGQEKNLRLYVRRPPYYKFSYETHVPDDGFITDFVCNARGDQLAYTISDDQFFDGENFREAYFSISYTMDDQHFVIGRAGGYISIFEAHENDIKAICCSKVNPSIFYSGCSNGFCKMWDYRTPNNCIPLATSTGNDYSITHIDSDSYDRYIVTTSGRVKFNIWDVRRFSENISFNMQQRQRTNLLDEISYFDKGRHYT